MSAEELTITLPADVAQMVRDRVAAGGYASHGDLIREALEMWSGRAREHEEALASVRAKIDAALSNPTRLTPAEVRRRLDRLHEETMRAKG